MSTATAWSTVRSVAVGRGGLRALPEAAALVPCVLAEIAERPGLAAVSSWQTHGSTWTSTGTATFPVGPPAGPPAAVLRLSATGGDRLRHETKSLAALRREPALADLRPLFPVRKALGSAGRWWYVLDGHIGGVDATAALVADPRLHGTVLRAGVRIATTMHRATAVPVRVDDEVLDRWVGVPIRLLTHALGASPMRLRSERLDLLRRRLRDGLAGHHVQASWVHGDLWLGNLRVEPDTGAVTGVIDWDCAGDRELPAHDLMHLALFGSSVQRGVSLGTVVAEVLTAGTWPRACEAILRHGRWSWGGVDDETVALLYWLRYVAAMAAQHRSYAEHSLLGWQVHNVSRVLRCL
jgi:hypothetical protein